MHTRLKYSLIEETINIFEIITHKRDYKDLRSVVFPSLKGVINAILYRDKTVKDYTDAWGKIEAEFNSAIVTAGLTPLNADIICFTHKFGCEGWFNIDKNQIHIRTAESSKRNIIDSIMHEILHIITYKPNMSYKEREDLVDKYMDLQSFQQLLPHAPPCQEQHPLLS